LSSLLLTSGVAPPPSQTEFMYSRSQRVEFVMGVRITDGRSGSITHAPTPRNEGRHLLQRHTVSSFTVYPSPEHLFHGSSRIFSRINLLQLPKLAIMSSFFLPLASLAIFASCVSPPFSCAGLSATLSSTHNYLVGVDAQQ